MTKRPLLSIVTPCMNRASVIGDAIDSVLEQDYPCVEHIVVDGGSNDGTQEVLASFEHLKWISEPDDNLYEALNKAILMSTGDVIGHLNSDDLYPANIFGEVMKIFAKSPNIGMVYGDACILSMDGLTSERKLQCFTNTDLSWENVTTGVSYTNARFFRRSVYEAIGLYNQHYRIASDREFLLRANTYSMARKRLKRPVYIYKEHQGSLTIGSTSDESYRIKSAEYVQIASNALESTENRELKTHLKKWIMVTTSEMVKHGLKKRDWRLAKEFLVAGMSKDLLWPFGFCSFLGKTLYRRLFTSLQRD